MWLRASRASGPERGPGGVPLFSRGTSLAEDVGKVGGAGDEDLERAGSSGPEGDRVIPMPLSVTGIIGAPSRTSLLRGSR